MRNWMNLSFDHNQNLKQQLLNANDTDHMKKKQKMSVFEKQTAAWLLNAVTSELSNAADSAFETDDNHQKSSQKQAVMTLI